MTTTIDYALMAGASYISTRAEVNQFPTPDGWLEMVDERKTKPSGFEATYFANGTDIVISFAGTGPGWGDWTNGNTPLALGLLATQLKEAADYYLQIKAQNPGAAITLTGHSLGGGLAALIAVMFDETAVTFDQAPFNQSALFFPYQPDPFQPAQTTSVAQELREELTGSQYESMLEKLDAYIAANSNNSNPIAEDTVAGRALNVTDINVQGEILSSLPLLNRIGTQTDLLNSNAGVSAIDLHSQALLAAFLQSGDTSTSTASDHTLGQVTFKLVDLLKMIFDKNLFAFDTDPSTNKENFLERIVKHETGVGVSATSAEIVADAMLTRFTADLWKLAQDGGLTISDGLGANTINNVSKALIAFAMQFYYEDTANAKDATKQLFKDLNASGANSNGVQFDIADVSKDIKAAFDGNQKVDLTKAKGYQYFKSYVEDIAKFTIEEQKLIQTLLPTLRDWYVQAGANGMSATDTNNRGAFMLGGTGADNLTGGSADDLLLANAGDDQLTGGDGVDNLIGGTGSDTLDGGAGNDNLKGGADYDLYKFSGTFGIDVVTDSDGQGGIELDGQTLSGGILKLESIYKDDITGYTSIKVNGGQNLIILKEGNADRIIIKNWADGNLGLNLTGDAPTAPTGNVMNGDFKKLIDDAGTADTNDDTYVMDDKGNYTRDPSALNGEPGAPDLINGTDAIANIGGKDVIYGLGGDDALSGKSGDDHIEGGGGGDVIQGGLGKDTLIGGTGDDSIYGSSDELLNPPTNVNFTKPVNNLAYPQGTGFNWIMGFTATYPNGTPKSTSDAARNRFDGDAGNLIDGGTGNDFIAAGTGADYVHGGADKDVIWGMDKDDILFGDGDNDVIYGDGNQQSASSVVWTLAANHGNDIIDGGDGEDIIYGQGGNDIIFGGAGNDNIWGDDISANQFDGNDYLNGGAGNKTIAKHIKASNKQACNPYGYWLAEHLFLFSLDTQKTAANDATYNNTNERIAA